jgi:hypothetical protein
MATHILYGKLNSSITKSRSDEKIFTRFRRKPRLQAVDECEKGTRRSLLVRRSAGEVEGEGGFRQRPLKYHPNELS